jgi:hypothetical protein
MQLCFTVGPGRNWLTLWKPTIDALGPVLCYTPAGGPWSPLDGRIVDLGLHRSVNPSIATTSSSPSPPRASANNAARSAWDSLTSLADPPNETLELRNELWLGVQSAFQLVYLVWCQPQQPVLGEHSPGPLHHSPCRTLRPRCRSRGPQGGVPISLVDDEPECC